MTWQKKGIFWAQICSSESGGADTGNSQVARKITPVADLNEGFHDWNLTTILEKDKSCRGIISR
jgi:hypothetical protein